MQKHLTRRFNGRKLHPLGVGFLNRKTPAGPLLLDHFTDVDATALASHTMDVGPGWTVSAGTPTVQSNKASWPNGTLSVVTADSGQANVTVTCVHNVSNATGNPPNNGTVVRFSDASNYWIAGPANSNSNFTLTERNAGVETNRASAAFSYTNNTDCTVVLACAGAGISGTANGASAISYGSAALNQTATVHGMRHASGTGTADDFQVTSP